MPRPSLRARSKKRIRVKSSGGSVETRYRKEKTNVSRCARCGRVLSGLPSSSQSKLHKLSASQRRIERIYGGYLCHICLQGLVKQAARKI